MTKLTLIIFFLTLGTLARHRGLSDEKHVLRLNQLIIYLPLPAIVISQVPFLQINIELLAPVLTPWLLVLPEILILWLLQKSFGWHREQFACLLICCALGNTAYLGYPMTTVLLGEEALATAIIYDQLGNFLLLAIFTSVVITWAKSAPSPGENPTKAEKPWSFQLLKRIVIRIFSFPPFLCLLLALNIPAEHMSGHLLQGLQTIGALLMPLAMISIGLQLDLKPAADILKPLLAGLTVKMIVIPSLVFLGLTLFGEWNTEQKTILLQSAMPPSVAAGALVTAAGLAPRLCAALVAYGMVISLVILPAWVALMTLVIG